MQKFVTPLTVTAVALATGMMLAMTGGAWSAGMPDRPESSGMSPSPSGISGQLTPTEQEAFSRLDINGDGKISETEAKNDPALAAKFKTVDKDQNHVVDEGEFAKFETETQNK